MGKHEIYAVGKVAPLTVVEADNFNYNADTGMLKYIKDGEHVAIFNINNIAGFKRVQDDATAESSRVPTALDYEGDGYDDNGNMIYDTAFCRNCRHEFEECDLNWGCRFCPDCGQALDWEGNNESIRS